MKDRITPTLSEKEHIEFKKSKERENNALEQITKILNGLPYREIKNILFSLNNKVDRTLQDVNLNLQNQ